MTKNNWSDGDSVTATQLNRMEDQLVVQCTSGTRPTGVEGQHIYETDTDRSLVYNGSAWVYLASNWTSFTPSWSNLTTGSGATNRGLWSYTPGGMWIFVELALGSGGGASGNILLTLPNSENALNQTVAMRNGWLSAIDADGTDSAVVAVLSPNSTQASFRMTTNAAINATVPFTWTSGDELIGSFFVPL